MSGLCEIIEDKRGKYNGGVPVSYTKGKFLGKGGFAKVYACVDNNTGDDCAIKCVEKSSLIKQKARVKLQSEIRIHRSLHSQRIVRYISHFEDTTHVYIVLELCAPFTLNDIHKRIRRFTEEETRYHILCLCDGLKYLHGKGIIHRDLKLGNLFLKSNSMMDASANRSAPQVFTGIGNGINDSPGTPLSLSNTNNRQYSDFAVDPSYSVCIGDLGLAAKLESDHDRRFTVCGTPNYIAPEVLDASSSKNNGHSYAADIWSIGVIMFTMLTGKPPFEDQDVKSTYSRIRKCQFSFPGDVEITPQAKDIIMTMLQTDQHLRPDIHTLTKHPWMQRNHPSSDLEEGVRIINNDRPPLPRSMKGNQQNTLKMQDCASYSLRCNKNIIEPTVHTPSHFRNPDFGRIESHLNSESHSDFVDKRKNNVNCININTRNILMSEKPRSSNSKQRTKSLSREEERFPVHIEKCPTERSHRVIDKNKNKNKNHYTPIDQKGIDSSDNEKDKIKTIVDTVSTTTSNRNILLNKKSDNISKVKTKIKTKESNFNRDSDSTRHGTNLDTLIHGFISDEYNSSHDKRNVNIDNNGNNNYRRIRTKDTASINNKDDDKPDDLTKRSTFVVKWCDYTHKYGVGYTMNDGTHGVHFNDGSGMVYYSPELGNSDSGNMSVRYFFWSEGECSETILVPKVFIHTDGMNRASLTNIIKASSRIIRPEKGVGSLLDIIKKVTLLKQFRVYLRDGVVRDGVSYGETKMINHSNSSDTTNGLSFDIEDLISVKKLASTKHAIFFQLSNSVIQVCFYDGSETLIQPKGGNMLYLDRDTREAYRFDSRDIELIRRNESTDRLTYDVAKRFRYIREVLSHVPSGTAEKIHI